MNPNYKKIDKNVLIRIEDDRKNHIENPYAFKDEEVIRRNNDKDKSNLWRPAFVRDCQKIINVPFFNRYGDKTQVFSLRKNDEISRRSYHVQLVSRFARDLGRCLNLNGDLIEAIALGHDIGHTPFGHAGEKIIDELLCKYSDDKIHFAHNIHSSRILDKICCTNLSLQTLDGIICHNGVMTKKVYTFKPVSSDINKEEAFRSFDDKVNRCRIDISQNKYLIPVTLEACVVRISDVAAYVGKDRQDAQLLKIINDDSMFTRTCLGNNNAEILNNLLVDIVNNSYGKDSVTLSEEANDALVTLKDENYKYIYGCPSIVEFNNELKPLFEMLYLKFKDDLQSKKLASYIFTHHINHLFPNEEMRESYISSSSCDEIVVDYLASMTDDYFLDLYLECFPGKKLPFEYFGYFD